MTKLTFVGGAGAVTGSNFLIETEKAKFLVDCGLRQGRDEDEDQNKKDFPYDPASVSHLIITHAHIDHIGRIPKLVKDGFKGTIISTAATKALAKPLLHDALAVMGREPLFSAHDIAQALSLWRTLEYHEEVSLPDDITLRFLDAGHILGSAMAEFRRNGVALVVTGDLGGGNSPLLKPAETPHNASYVVMESVYGDKKRSDDKDRRELLENVIEESSVRGGTLLIPAFSTERTQDLLFEIRALMTEHRVPSMPVYVDSPLAEEVTDVFKHFLPAAEFRFSELHFVKTPEESKALEHAHNPKIILAGSGMGSGGRIGTHEQYVLPDPKSTICIVGYQAAGSIGRQLVEGASQIKLWGKSLPVRSKVESIYGYSAHMDGEALLEFANRAAEGGVLKEIFVVEGEPASASFLAQRIRDYLGVKATTPEAGESAVISL